MKILHYFLGFPPYRSGGLTKYAFDLMQTQVKDGNSVMALWPGKMGGINHKVLIKRRKEITGIQNFELINPLPVSLDEGIKEFDAYMKVCDPEIYETFFKQIKPEVIHIHTLMGLHKEFIEVAEKSHIRTVFTTHDYFGICPKVTLYRYGESCENDHGCRDCILCNYSALSLKKIMIMQSWLYRKLKNFSIVKRLRMQHREEFFANEEIPEIAFGEEEVIIISEQYKQLRLFYIDMLERIDCIHFNSSVAEKVYKRYIEPQNSIVMTITHKNIADNRNTNKCIVSDKLRIVSLAPTKPYKGFNILRTALDELWNSGNHDFELKLFSPVQCPSPYMTIYENGFLQSELAQIFSTTDVLVAPSIWYETFGFTVLEAISYGIPVIVSNRVGAQDVIGKGGIIIKAGSVDELKEAVLKFTRKDVQLEKKKNVLEHLEIKTWDTLTKENYCLYRF